MHARLWVEYSLWAGEGVQGETALRGVSPCFWVRFGVGAGGGFE
jgi:hypothetical protein